MHLQCFPPMRSFFFFASSYGRVASRPTDVVRKSKRFRIRDTKKLSFAVRNPISAQDDVREFPRLHHVVWQQRLDRGWGGVNEAHSLEGRTACDKMSSVFSGVTTQLA
jgi:hypothetical protein